MKRTVFVITALVTIFLAFGYIASLGTLTPIPNAYATSRTIMLSGSFATGWNRTNPGPTITLIQGDAVTIHLVSSDGAPHTFIIDVAHAGVVPSPNCSVDKCSSQFSSSTTFTFSADMAPGTYTYYCSIHLQHMTGSLVVQSSSNNAPDFTGTASPTSLSFAQGSSASATITLTSLNGFSGTITLTATVSSSGPAVSLSSTSVSLNSNSLASSMLTVSAASGGLYSTPVSSGSYTVTVTETSGSLSHSTAIPISIGSSSSGPNSSGSTSSMPGYSNGSSGTLLLIGAAVLIIVVAAIVIVAVARTRARP